jgi:hypothetical protein
MQIYVARKNKTYIGLHVKFLASQQNCSFSTMKSYVLNNGLKQKIFDIT